MLWQHVEMRIEQQGPLMQKSVLWNEFHHRKTARNMTVQHRIMQYKMSDNLLSGGVSLPRGYINAFGVVFVQ